MSEVFGSRAVFLMLAIGTHGIVGYTLGAYLFDAPAAGLVGGIVADIDLLFPMALGMPFVHRGITHTALAAGAATAVSTYWGRRTAGGVGIGYGSQLVIDATTSKGIPLLYPFSSMSIGIALGGHSLMATVVLWAGCLGLLWYRE